VLHPRHLDFSRATPPVLADWANLWRTSAALAKGKGEDRNLKELGIVLAKQLLKGGGGRLVQGVDSLDQAEDIGGHY
jgi:hypothetical protein